MSKSIVSGIFVISLLWWMSLGAWVSVLLSSWVLFQLWSDKKRFGTWLLILGLAVIPESLYCLHRIGKRARAGSLTPKEQLGVYGFNLVFGGAAWVLGFPEFGIETLSLAAPRGHSAPCPSERLLQYGDALPRTNQVPVLRSWNSDFAMRSPRIQKLVQQWARTLPSDVSNGTKRVFPSQRGLTWPASAYFSTDEANGVPIALNAPTTTLEGRAFSSGRGHVA